MILHVFLGLFGRREIGLRVVKLMTIFLRRLFCILLGVGLDCTLLDWLGSPLSVYTIFCVYASPIGIFLYIFTSSILQFPLLREGHFLYYVLGWV